MAIHGAAMPPLCLPHGRSPRLCSPRQATPPQRWGRPGPDRFFACHTLAEWDGGALRKPAGSWRAGSTPCAPFGRLHQAWTGPCLWKLPGKHRRSPRSQRPCRWIALRISTTRTIQPATNAKPRRGGPSAIEAASAGLILPTESRRAWLACRWNISRGFCSLQTKCPFARFAAVGNTLPFFRIRSSSVRSGKRHDIAIWPYIIDTTDSVSTSWRRPRNGSHPTLRCLHSFSRRGFLSRCPGPAHPTS